MVLISPSLNFYLGAAGLTALLTFCLNIMQGCFQHSITKDILPKIVALALAVASLVFVTEGFCREIILTSCVLIAGVTLVRVLCNRKSRPHLRSKQKVWVISQTVFINIGLFGYELVFGNVSMILAEPNFLVCLVFPLISLAVTYLLDTALCYLRFTELIRRKTFHFMPLLILPYLHCLNPQLLVVALSVGFHLLLSVEMMRFLSGSKSKRRNYFINEVHSPHSFRWLQQVDLLRSCLTGWMATLNTREPQFWFTHLYLVAALCISYAIDLKYLLSQSRLLPVSPHIVLVLMAADAMAALFGLKYGKRRMFKNKTWVGYLAFVLTYCIGASLSSLLYPFNFQLSVLLNQLQSNLIYHLSIGLVLGVVEVFSGDLDNISTLGAFWMMRYVWLWSDLYS